MRDELIRKQNKSCLALVNEIERVRLLASKLTATEIETILEILQRNSSDPNNSQLISASQLLQVLSDENMLENLASMDDAAEQRAVYSELMVGFLCISPKCLFCNW